LASRKGIVEMLAESGSPNAVTLTGNHASLTAVTVRADDHGHGLF